MCNSDKKKELRIIGRQLCCIMVAVVAAGQEHTSERERVVLFFFFFGECSLWTKVPVDADFPMCAYAFPCCRAND